MENTICEEDYESLPDSANFKTHMFAGACAGITEHCIFYPVDCIKTRMMILNPHVNATYKSVPQAIIHIFSIEGIGTSFRGVQAMALGTGPSHAMYFASYEKLKKSLSQSETGNDSIVAQSVAGSIATLIHDTVMTPAEVIKQRMQIYGSPYSSCLHCGKTIFVREGFRALYRSFSTQLVMNIPFGICHFTTYEFMQNQMNEDRSYNPTSHIVSGSVAGACASALTTPLDVCKTLLNTQNCACTLNSNYSSNITGMVNAMKIIYNCKGLRGFVNGMSARVIYQTPSTALSWSVYEFFKYSFRFDDTSENSNINSYTNWN